MKYLCKKIPKLEWSGILFYTVTGSIIEADKMVIEVHDILLMDIGNKVHTEYNWDEAVVAYQMEHLEAMEWNKGHVHSHNDMNVYFSGEDWSELNDNSPNHNIYVSLIVNNWMEMEAKIAFTGQQVIKYEKTKKYMCKDENGDEYSLTMQAEPPKELPPVMFVYDCEIIKPEQELSVEDEFISRFKIVETEKAEATKRLAAEAAKKSQQTANPATSATSYAVGSSKDYNNNNSRFLPGNTRPQYQPSTTIPDWNGKPAHSQPLNDAFDDEKYLPLAGTETYKYDKFLAYILNMGNETQLKALTVAGDMKYADTPKVIQAIETSYTAYYDRWFEKETGYGTVEHFDEVISDIRDNLLGMPWDMDEIIDVLDDVDEQVQKTMEMATMMTQYVGTI